MIKIGLVGCGNQFRDVYLDVINKLIVENHVKIKIIYSRNTSKIEDLKFIFDCEITDNIKDIIENDSIDLLIISIPQSQRRKFFYNNLKKFKFILSEVPFSSYLGDFYFFKRKIDIQEINFEVFEDRFYFNYDLSKFNEAKLVVNFNKQWMHHSISQIFKIKNNPGDLIKVRYNTKNTKYDIYKIYFSNLKFLYYFSKQKKEADRTLGYVKIINSKKENHYLEHLNSNFKNNKQQALYNCIYKLLDKNNKKELYFNKFLELEALIITIMKLMKKFKIQSFTNFQIKVIKKVFKIFSYFLY